MRATNIVLVGFVGFVLVMASAEAATYTLSPISSTTFPAGEAVTLTWTRTGALVPGTVIGVFQEWGSSFASDGTCASVVPFLIVPGDVSSGSYTFPVPHIPPATSYYVRILEPVPGGHEQRAISFGFRLSPMTATTYRVTVPALPAYVLGDAVRVVVQRPVGAAATDQIKLLAPTGTFTLYSIPPGTLVTVPVTPRCAVGLWTVRYVSGATIRDEATFRTVSEASCQL